MNRPANQPGAGSQKNVIKASRDRPPVVSFDRGFNGEKMKIFKISAPILVPLVLVLNVVSGLAIVEKDGSDALVVDPEVPEQIAEVEEQGGSARQEAAKEEPVPVKYDGAQLWRVDYDDQDKRNAVAELQDKFGV